MQVVQAEGESATPLAVVKHIASTIVILVRHPYANTRWRLGKGHAGFRYFSSQHHSCAFCSWMLLYLDGSTQQV